MGPPGIHAPKHAVRPSKWPRFHYGQGDNAPAGKIITCILSDNALHTRNHIPSDNISSNRPALHGGERCVALMLGGSGPILMMPNAHPNVNSPSPRQILCN